jgi:hypothetical protein
VLREVGDSLHAGVETQQELHGRALGLTRESVHTSLDAAEAISGESATLDDLRESADETFDTLDEQQEQAFDTVDEEYDALGETYDEFSDDTLETLSGYSSARPTASGTSSSTGPPETGRKVLRRHQTPGTPKAPTPRFSTALRT